MISVNTLLQSLPMMVLLHWKVLCRQVVLCTPIWSAMLPDYLQGIKRTVLYLKVMSVVQIWAELNMYGLQYCKIIIKLAI